MLKLSAQFAKANFSCPYPYLNESFCVCKVHFEVSQSNICEIDETGKGLLPKTTHLSSQQLLQLLFPYVILMTAYCYGLYKRKDLIK